LAKIKGIIKEERKQGGNTVFSKPTTTDKEVKTKTQANINTQTKTPQSRIQEL